MKIERRLKKLCEVIDGLEERRKNGEVIVGSLEELIKSELRSEGMPEPIIKQMVG